MSSKTQTSNSPQLDYKPREATPIFYKVLIHNDDYTPMEFVVHILELFFDRSIEESTRIMLSVHNEGVGVAGIYSKDIAATKSQQVNHYSQENEHPLKTSIEKEVSK